MKAYRFQIQLSTDVVIEDDSGNPMTKDKARVFVIDNIKEYIDSANLSECYVSEGVELK